MHNPVVELIKKQIESFEPEGKLEHVGRVIKVGDGVAEIEGLPGAKMSELLEFDTADGKPLKDAMGEKGVVGVVLNLEEDSVKAVLLGETSHVFEGMLVRGSGNVLSIPVSDAMRGRVVNPLGEPIDGKGPIKAEKMNPVERIAYGVIERQSVNTPLHSGIKAIDAMIPIGRGQRELIIGDRYSGKTTVAIDTIINQKHEPEESRPTCIYVAIGQKESKTARLVAELAEQGALEYTIIVDAPASAPAALQYLAPFAGAAIGEYFMEKGQDALIVYDDLSKHAVAYRQLSLLLRRPPGREAYPGDIFYLHSRLLERAARLSKELGGGSLTALPIIETQEGDVSAYIPTNVISITDGQIFLDLELFNKGMRPAINPGISVSRVGSSAQTKAMKKVSGKIRLELAQFRELEAFMQFAQDLDEDTKKRIESGQQLSEILKQGKHETLPFELQALVIYAATNGFFEGIPAASIGKAERSLILFLGSQHKKLIAEVRDTRDIGKETEPKVKTALEAFRAAHRELLA